MGIALDKSRAALYVTALTPTRSRLSDEKPLINPRLRQKWRASVLGNAFGLCNQIQSRWQFAGLFHLFGLATAYDNAYAIRGTSSGNAYVTGETDSPDFPVTTGVPDSLLPSSNNTGGAVRIPPTATSSNTSAFVTKLKTHRNGPCYSTFLGGNGSWAYATALPWMGLARLR